MSLALKKQRKQTVVKQLIQQPERFEFQQVVRLLHAMGRTGEIQWTADAMPHGGDDQVMAFEALGTVNKITVCMEALSGARGVLPDYLYEELLASLHDEEAGLHDFLDIFNHRYYQLMHRTQVNESLVIRAEQQTRKGARVQQSATGNTCLTQLSALPDTTGDRTGLLRFSILMGLKVRSISSLRQLLSEYFPYKIHIEVTPARKQRLTASSFTRIGVSQAQNNQLGLGFLLGKECSLNFQQLQILIEPASREEFVQLKNDQNFSQTIHTLVRAYLRESADVLFYLYVKRAFLSLPVLSANAATAVQLGESNCLEPQAKPEEYQKILLK
ncbi:type VI secretion system baseplate subunit TssG [Litoribrevibacter euphylliae]|uniref:Type VI secretion system baseplate subunit TssG n=1 Tax=Litoribrevibacter euphylliae TaxID=1834034 RepID=A0ABV7HJT7_9GAMM